MDPIFQVYRLNESGLKNAQSIADSFSSLLNGLNEFCNHRSGGREFAIVRTKLEEACFFAKKAMAKNPDNHVIEVQV